MFTKIAIECEAGIYHAASEFFYRNADALVWLDWCDFADRRLERMRRWSL